MDEKKRKPVTIDSLVKRIEVTKAKLELEKAKKALRREKRGRS